MYLFELIIKKFFCKKQKPLRKTKEEAGEEERCDHIFMPIDSTGEILACSKCGAIVRKNKLNRNAEKN